MTLRSLESWLSYIESQHPSEIELGLARGNQVLDRLHLSRPKHKVITVAGTNGKGSTCAMLTQYLHSENLSVGTYTSPHFLAFNERIAINNTPCDDDMICRAFDAIEAVRGDIALTYFEFSTLAALWIFDQLALDYWVLEVGLGGRLDSVNMIDTDVAVITSIALDHTDWLGDNLDIIAQEKAGIARKGKLLVSGVVNPPKTIANTALDIGADLKQKGEDFNFSVNGETWSWTGAELSYENLPIPCLPLQNAATAIAVLAFIGLKPTQENLVHLFQTTELTGRFQKVSADPDIYIDVAHNPEAALELVGRLKSLSRPPIAVCGMLKDKDIDSVIKYLANSFSDWFCCDLDGPRGAKGQDLIDSIVKYTPSFSNNTQSYRSVEEALNAALIKAKEEHRALVVFGSFVTVSEYLMLR